MISGELARRAEAMVAERVPFVTATVVRAQHPTSVRPGDTAIVDRDGTIDGFVGGLCAEESVRLHALRVLETGEALLLRILPEDGDGEPPNEGAVTVHNPCLSGGALEIFLEPRLPAPVILVHGDTPVADALAKLAEVVGYAVERSGERRRERASDAAAVVVASHGRDEEDILAAALTGGVPYVGLVASPARGAAVREALEVPDELKAQLRTPAGLDIGARTPEEIALSILAQIVAASRRAAFAARAGHAEVG
jgi:xanthine dehydrogenase accessory factor